MSRSHEVGGQSSPLDDAPTNANVGIAAGLDRARPNVLVPRESVRRLIATRDAVEMVLLSYIIGGLSAHDALVEVSRVISKDTGEDVLKSCSQLQEEVKGESI